jgi:predicted site-specific integrase-resolvase
MIMEKLYKPSDIARICNVTTPTIHNWIKKGVLKVISFPHGRKKITRDCLEQFLRESGMEGAKIDTPLTYSTDG